MKGGLFFTTLLTAWIFHDTVAITLGPFENVTGGVWDAWAKDDAANVKGGGRFSVQFGQDRLWLISRRMHRLNFDTPWDAASRGGIVSTLLLRSNDNSSNKTNNVWIHKPYGRLDEDSYGEKLFSMRGRLFMLTYRVVPGPSAFYYHKLFFWDDDLQGGASRWLEVPLTVDPSVTITGAAVPPPVPNSSASPHLSLSVPDQARGHSAYLVASLHGYASRGSQMSYLRLDLDFRGDGTVLALGALKLVNRVQDPDEPSAVFFCALRNRTTLYGFLQQMYSEGYVSEYGYAYALDFANNNNNASKVQLTSSATSAGGDGQQQTSSPTMQFDEERMFQSADEMFMVGGYRVEGLGQVRNVRDVWALNLDEKRWRPAKNGQNVLPDNDGNGDYEPTYDQRNAKLYLVNLKTGVKVAPVYT